MTLQHTCRTVFERIYQLTQGKIFNDMLAQPLNNNIHSFEEAQLAFKQRCKEYADKVDQQRLLRILFATYMPTFITSSLMDCFGGLFLSHDEHQLAKATIVENQKKYAVGCYLQTLTPAYKEKHQAALQAKVNLMAGAEAAIAGVQNGIHNCISINTLVIFELLAQGIPDHRIEYFHTDPAADDTHPGHNFVVVNRQKNSNKNDMGTWGPDCYIVDPWYGYWGKAVDLHKDKERFSKYFLLMNLQSIIPGKVFYERDQLVNYTKRLNEAIKAAEEISAPHIAKKRH